VGEPTGICNSLQPIPSKRPVRHDGATLENLRSTAYNQSGQFDDFSTRHATRTAPRRLTFAAGKSRISRKTVRRAKAIW
jgi:hypothetical protein